MYYFFIFRGYKNNSLMSIEHKLTALYKLRSEYKTLNTQKRELCERKKALETQIQEYLSQHGLPRL